MSLATRCIHCGTIFKIVEDQLKVSEGWVRCGRCNEVFNALPTLFDMDSEAPPPRRAPVTPPLQEPVTEAFTPPAPVWSPPAPDPQIEDELPPEPAAPPRPIPSPLAPPPMPEAELPSTDESDALDSRYLMPSDQDRPLPHRRTRGPEFADAEFPTDALLDEEAAAEASAAARATSTKKPSKKPAVPPTPDFIRRAQRQAFWRQPSVRGLLTGLVLALLLALGVQAVHQFRDILAAQHPSWRDALTRWCELAHCTLQPPLRIDALQVDSATLQRADSEGPDHYRLSVVVRNSAAMALAWPHVDLTLTDISGAVVARRSFSPADAQWADGSESPPRFAPRPSAVPPQRATTLVWQLRAPTLQPAGYTAELFYP